MVEEISKLLEKYFNREIDEEEFIFRRVPLKIFLSGVPEHRLEIVPQIFRNEQGDGMSVDWERICESPEETQRRGGKDPLTHGVVVLNVGKIRQKYDAFKTISDQNPYPAHCLVKGIPISLRQLKRINRDEHGKLKPKEKKVK